MNTYPCQREGGGQDDYLDLLFYHHRLRCLVAIDLKMDDFKPEYAGKMNFYLSALDDLLRHPSDNASLGIVLCKGKNRTVAEYALRDVTKPIGVAEVPAHAPVAGGPPQRAPPDGGRWSASSRLLRTRAGKRRPERLRPQARRRAGVPPPHLRVRLGLLFEPGAEGEERLHGPLGASSSERSRPLRCSRWVRRVSAPSLKRWSARRYSASVRIMMLAAAVNFRFVAVQNVRLRPPGHPGRPGPSDLA